MTTIDLQRERHLIEQLAYEEIRLTLRDQFLTDPVSFLQEHGKRPEDFNGADLRSHYRTCLELGREIRATLPGTFRRKFQEGLLFPEVVLPAAIAS